MLRRRECEIADLLSFMERVNVRNTVWLTADMHHTAAHHYDPNRAVFQDFEPFREFVSGPLDAGTWGPGMLDNTFGRLDIDGRSEVMTVTLKDVGNRDLWSVDIEPRPDERTNRLFSQHF